MDTLRITLAVIFSFATVVISKLFTGWVENIIKEWNKEKADKIIEIMNNFYFIISLGFAVLLTFVYPVFIFKELKNVDGIVLNLITYVAGILVIYHWLFKVFIDKFISYIQNFKK